MVDNARPLRGLYRSFLAGGHRCSTMANLKSGSQSHQTPVDNSAAEIEDALHQE